MTGKPHALNILDAETVISLRQRFNKEPQAYSFYSAELGVSETCVTKALMGSRVDVDHIIPPCTPPGKKGIFLTPAQVVWMRQDHDKRGTPLVVYVELFGASSPAIQNAIKKPRKDVDHIYPPVPIKRGNFQARMAGRTPAQIKAEMAAFVPAAPKPFTAVPVKPQVKVRRTMPEIPDHTWKTVVKPECGERYKISSAGHIWLCDKSQMAEATVRAGVRCFDISGNGQPLRLYIGRLVLDHFGPPAGLGQDRVVFKDGNQFNCNIENLCWGDLRDRYMAGKEQDPRKALQSMGDDEEWKEITKGYLVSNYGRVYSVMSEDTISSIHPYGYVLAGINGKTHFVHRLVAKAFVPGRTTEKNVVDHIENDRENNHYTNLRWITGEENTSHYYNVQQHLPASVKRLLEKEEIRNRGIDEAPGEKWIDVLGQYSISNFGRVLENRARKFVTELDSNGYQYILNGKAVHIIVAREWCNNPNNFPYVNHIDGKPHHNHYKNLEFTTPKGNSEHAVRMGLMLQGSNHPSTVLTDEDVITLRLRYAEDPVPFAQMAREYYVSRQTIAKAICQPRWGIDELVPPVTSMLHQTRQPRIYTPKEVTVVKSNPRTAGWYRQVRQMYLDGLSHTEISQILGDNRNAVTTAIHGVTGAWVTEDMDDSELAPKGPGNLQAKYEAGLTARKVVTVSNLRDIIHMRDNQHLEWTQIAEKLGFHWKNMSNAYHGKYGYAKLHDALRAQGSK